MQIDTVYVRFFRSLNYDYLRKSDPGYVPDPWDRAPGGAHYPFVEVRLEPDITTVVGANESGKSQLLDAIKRGLTGKDIDRGDFCRYSPFFSNDTSLTLPEFGIGFRVATDAERDVIESMCELEARPAATKAALFRMNQKPKTRLYLHDGETWVSHHVKKPNALKDLGLPMYFEIDSDVPLPDAVPLDFLVSGKLPASTAQEGFRRGLDRIAAKADSWFASADALRSSADDVMAALGGDDEIDDKTLKAYHLADDLLTKVANLDRDLFTELQAALSDKRNGYANSIVDKINEELAKSLNFPHWWSQDSAFQLVVDPRRHELVFVIHDRTGTSYSFDERSAGLKYFLSYFVQYLSHQRPADGQSEILLMDEPDAYLSSSGQQDLLRIFAAFARPESPDEDPVQVVYVTHSPFLIDKNHAERIRVLEKGEHDEGTRVVANASRNHYEPLRSALGSFVGETTFIGTCNLLLEGPSDQILLAGISSWLARDDVSSTQRLDLNTITLVPTGSASHVPYLAFLARGRDVDRPPVIVLLDGDQEGDRAKAALARGGPRRKQLIPPEYIVQLSDSCLKGITSTNPSGPAGIEDLVPMDLAVEAVKLYCEEFAPDVDLGAFVADADTIFDDGRDLHKGLQDAVRAHVNDAEFDLDKIGFARSVIAAIESSNPSDGAPTVLRANFMVLLAELAKRQRVANRDASQEKVQSRVKRVRKRFAADHQQNARREDVLLLIEEIEGQLDSSVEAEEVRATMRAWVRDFKLEDEPRVEMDDFPRFLQELDGLAYAGTRAVQAKSSAE